MFDSTNARTAWESQASVGEVGCGGDGGGGDAIVFPKTCQSAGLRTYSADPLSFTRDRGHAPLRDIIYLSGKGPDSYFFFVAVFFATFFVAGRSGGSFQARLACRLRAIGRDKLLGRGTGIVIEVLHRRRLHEI